MGGRGGEDLGELQQPQGRDPGAAPHPKLALGRHHHSHHHTITNRVRESQRGKDRGRALTPGLREREREREQLQACNHGMQEQQCGGRVGVMGVLIVYLLHLL